jgi:hypothetical protein
MPVFDERAVIEYLRRSYIAVDGLWFVKAEELLSSEEAMILDEQVWQIMPKIQARKAKELLKIEGGSLRDLALALWLKFAAEGYEHRVAERTPHILRIHVHVCPWLEVLKKAGRMSTAADVCDRICAREGVIWAREFSPDIEFRLESKLSEGAPVCNLLFTRPLLADTMPPPVEQMEAAA